MFVKIFISFLIIIFLFSLFHVLSFTFFINNIQNQIIQYNRLILKNAAERYNTHFSRVKTLLFNYYHDKNVVGFNRQLLTKPELEVDFLKAKEVILNLRTDIYNPLFYLDNIIIYFDSNSFTIDKDGSSDAKEMFSRFYKSDTYSFPFWQRQFERTDTFRLLPAATFMTGSDSSEKKELIPFTFKMPSSNYQVIALLDVRKMQRAFLGDEENRHFMILNEYGTVIYRSSGDLSAGNLPVFAKNADYSLKNGHYYFAEKDEEGKLTYITIVPYASIASQVQKLNYTLLFIFVLSIAIGLLASLYLSNRINSPVKQIISSILDRNPSRLRSRIREFDFINQQIHDLLREKDKIQSALMQSKSILTSYNYINKLKSINTDISEWKDFIEADESFTIILYELHFRAATLAELDIKPDRVAYYFREHINLIISERFPNSHTFQIENNQILSVISGNAPREQIRDTLETLKQILDRDIRYCLVTIAVSSLFEHSSQFNLTYRQVQEMVQQAKLLEETRLIFEIRSLDSTFALTPSQDQELNARLQAGNAADCTQLIERWLDDMHKKEASVSQFRLFADAVSSKAMKMLEIHKIDPDRLSELKPLVQRLKECCTLDEYKRAFGQFFASVAALVRAKKEEQDPIVTFVMDVLQTKYAEDISLDYLADKLNMSSAYLSVYIKEKTGVNFSDHLNIIRIRKAKELLVGTDMNIHDISRLIGYRNITSFNRMFKKWTGMTPGEYRKNNAVLDLA